MALQMTDIAVRLPERTARRAGYPTSRKPMAEVTCTVEGGRVREIAVPTRVARLLAADAIGLPREENEAFDAIHELEGRVCFTMLTELLARRDHAPHEAHDKLAAYGFREEEIAAALQRASELRFLDEGRFVASFIEERKRRGWGRRRIELELSRRGVELEAVPGYPDAFFSEEDDAARAAAVLARKPTPAVRPFDKLVRHLMGKGFSYAVAADAVRDRLAAAEHGDAPAWDAV